MHENKFEKQVQDKMNELGFQPREELWANVDREINKEKKRRPLFWIFFFSGLILAGGGLYYTVNKNNSTSFTQSISRLQDSKKVSQATIKKAENKTIPNPSAPRNAVMVLWQQAYQNKNEQRKKMLAEKMPEHETVGLKANKKTEQTTAKENPDVSGNEVPQAGTDSVNSISKTQPVTEVKNIIKDSSSTQSAPVAVKKKKKFKSWQIGFAVGAGVSNFNQGLFTSSPLYASNSSAPPGGGSTGGPVYSGSSSNINPGFSFYAGFFVSRNLSERISLSGGMNYHYYSAKIQTGNLVNNSFSMNGIYALSYYNTGNNQPHTNQYHFIEVPINLDFRMNKSSRLPVYGELGLSPSYLISVNALNYYPLSNVYIKDEAVFNKFQLGAAASILIGMKTGHGEFRLGPQLQYGITSMLKSGVWDSQHLLYGGLKFVFLPIKK